MKTLFLIVTASLFLFTGTLSMAGIDYLQYREEFEKQELQQTPLQHKSSQERYESIQVYEQKKTKVMSCNKTFYHKHHKKSQPKHSAKKCNS